MLYKKTMNWEQFLLLAGSWGWETLRENYKNRCHLSWALRAEWELTRQMRWGDLSRKKRIVKAESYEKRWPTCIKGWCGQSILNGLEKQSGNSVRARKKRATCPLHPLYLILRQAVSCKEFGLQGVPTSAKSWKTIDDAEISAKKLLIHLFINQVFNMQCLRYDRYTDWEWDLKVRNTTVWVPDAGGARTGHSLKRGEKM